MRPIPDFAIASQKVLTLEGEKPAAILIKGEKILDVVSIENIPENCPTEDMRNNVIMPGLVDAHVHINEPGRTDWEGFETATKSAAAGGITTLVDMPLNCIPVTTTVDALNQKIIATIDQLWIDCGFYGGLIPDNIQDLESLADAGVLGFKAFLSPSGIDEFPNISEKHLREALPILAKKGIPVLVHAELENEATSSEENKTYKYFQESRPKSWENNAIKLLIQLCREFNVHIHIVHLSSADILPEIAQTRKDGFPLTVETCPHYLHFSSERISDGDTRFKCAPPIWNGENRENLWAGLEEGIINFITSDHSPCTPELKNLEAGNFEKAWGGISSIQFALPVIWTECKQRGYSLEQLINWMSKQPAKFVGMDDLKGQISPGFDADLVCWNPDKKYIIKKEAIHHKNKLTPYEGESLYGVVNATFLRGQKVYENGQFLGNPKGKIVLK
ncbi:allantoinase AllB [Candidatus Marinimicrobia bacterium]|nr:allantoinase AllB [Candidatus Neomarinimicrobiota bacterium]MDC1037630.1 allantoinase AllB [Candidatus Neomarinimicrobiota bacterium]